MAESMKDIKRQMKSVESTAHITSAMQLVSAAKFRRAKARFDKVRDQLQEVNAVMEGILQGAEALPAKYTALGVRTSYILISSNRGLCGGFNSGLFKALQEDMAAMEAAGAARKDLAVYGVGSRGVEHFQRMGCPVPESFLTAPEKMTFREIRQIAAPVLKRFEKGETDRVVLVYAAYINSLRQEPVVKQVLPLEPPGHAPQPEGVIKSGGDSGQQEPQPERGSRYDRDSGTPEHMAAPPGKTAAAWRTELEFLPSAQGVLEYMVPKYFEMQLYQAIIESAVCEHAARRTAMENASGNAKEMLAGLSLTYNRARQQAITDELIEIVSGSEAL